MRPGASHAIRVFDVEAVRRDFPMLRSKMNGHPLVYLDNAATTQKPLAVIERLDRFFKKEYATVHRGIYTFSQESTRECDEAREKCRAFLGASKTAEILFVRGATEALNLVAASWGRKFLKAGDQVVISEIEHHSNIVPWQRLRTEKGIELAVLPVNDKGELLLDALDTYLKTGRVKLVSVAHVSNALGTVHPIQEITARAHRAGALVLIDGAQGAPHCPVDVREIDCDFYCFSGHKLYGPTGIGVLYGKEAILNSMDPYQSGGDMIESVTFERTTWAPLPAKFEAGTPPIAEIIALGEAIDYIVKLGLSVIRRAEDELLSYANDRLGKIAELRVIGTAEEKASLVSFELENIHPHDVGTVLNEEGIAVRAGHHCAQPAMRRFGVPATTRASFAFYNTREEIDALVEGIRKTIEVFK